MLTLESFLNALRIGVRLIILQLRLVCNWGARLPRGQSARRAIAEAKLRSQRPAIGWVTKIYYIELLRASKGMLSRWSRLHLQSLTPTPVLRRVDVSRPSTSLQRVYYSNDVCFWRVFCMQTSASSGRTKRLFHSRTWPTSSRPVVKTIKK
jgi:hypothetical protein